MKLFGALLFLLSQEWYEANAQAVATIPCPAAGAPPTVIPSSSTTSSTTVHIPIISSTNGLCTLLRHNSTDNTQRAPVARSYANRGDWEVSAGLFSGRTPAGASTVERVVVDCTAEGLDPNECEIVLPPLEHSTQEYILESFEYETSAEVEAARFLEQATFGPTRETIDDMVSTANDFESWVHDQMYNVPASSLRKFYRERVNPKWEHSYHSGTVSSQPCELYSRWRKYAISSKDLLNNRKTDIYKILVVTHEAGIGYVWKVDGEFRTVTQEPPVFLKYYQALEQNEDVLEGVSFNLGGRYRIKHQAPWQTDCVGCLIPLYKPTGNIDSRTWFGGIRNPEVNFAGYESQLEFGVLNLPTFKSPDFPVIDNPDEYHPLWEKFLGYDENAILNTLSLEGSAQCTDMYNFRQPRMNKDWVLGSAEVWKIFPTVFGKSADGHMFLYDPHLALPENSVENPSPDGGGQLAIDTAGLAGMSNYNGRYDGTSVGCQNAVMSYENEGNCKLSYLESACTPGETPKEVIILNDANLEGIRAETGLKLYAVSGWTIEAFSPEKPCGSSKFVSQKSRWIKDEADTVCDNLMNLREQSIKLFQDIIDQRDHMLNDNIVDAEKKWRACDTADETRSPFPFLGNVKTRDGSCWKHSHKNDMNVYDLSSVAGIDSFISPGSSIISVSEALYDVIRDLIPIGRYGDHLEVNGDLKAPLNGGDIQAAFKSYVYNPASRPVLICGTPNEVSSDPLTGEKSFTVVEPEGTGFRRLKISDLSSQRHTIWYHFAMNNADQLRLRMAWALSQIIAIGLPGSGMTFYEPTEDRLAMYDLYVRGAFGSYRDMLRDFSYNKIMASWLSFYENASLQYNLLGEEGVANFPDENYAREIMQLFSIGLYHLNMDGTNVLLDNGKLAETYTIEDILSYSRAWTGFRLPWVRSSNPKSVQNIARGGNSLSGRQWTDTAFEPMEIDVNMRDLFPKTDLMNGYIGDRVPLCVDLPKKHALRKGAVFKLLGSDQRGLAHGDPLEWDSIPDLKRLELSSTSPLFAKLCAEGPGGECTFPSLVELDENLVYNVNDNHPEFQVDTIRVIKLRKGESGVVNYEYIRQPCVEQSFFNNGKKVFWGGINGRKEQVSRLDGRTRAPWEMEASMCAHPSTEAASPICSASDWETKASYGFIHCNYHGERVTFATAEDICQAQEPPLVQGQPAQYKENQSWAGPCGVGMQNGRFRSWTSKSCGIKVKIDFKSGHIAIVHNPADDGNDIIQVAPRVEPMVSEAETMNFFKAPWTNGYPDDESKCLALSSSGTCKIHQDESPPRTKYCVCDTDTRDAQVFSSVSEVSSINDLMNALFVGAVDPSTFDAGTYTNLGDCGLTDVTVFTTDYGGDCQTLSSESIFAFEWKSKQFFLKNVVSMVHIDDATGNSYSFRNPVQFHSLANPSQRDSVHETDAVIDSLFYHPTHPPFLAVRVIQRFGISNPSPGFVHRVATAYSTGTFGQFGSGKYGDLGAMAASILLDDESRQVVLDKDQSHGQLREPLIKVLSFFRSQGLQYKSPLMVPTLIDYVQGNNQRSTIGQGAFESPSVFSFFLPEFSPPGVTQSAGISAPESMVFQGGNLLDLMEGVMSITKFGVVDCKGVSKTTLSRLGYKFEHAFNCPTSEGDTSFSPATTSYWPSSTSSVDDILDELALLMTAGRLSTKSRSLIKPIVSVPFNSGDIAKAVRAAQQLIWSSPEVHATNIPRIADSPRKPAGYETPVDPDSYKAVVVLMLLGGADSFNMLVPKKETIWLEYARARRSHKINNDYLLPLGNSGFGVHPALTTIADLYNQKDALWIQNLGTLGKPMNNTVDYVKESKFQLYAHNTMQHEFYTCDPYEENPGTGVFGRMLDMLREKRGYQTSANSISGGGGLMLTGDQAFNSPVFGIGLNPLPDLDLTPTVENLYETVKEINGNGEVGNSFFSDTWSSRLSTALFEHEQLKKLGEMDEFESPDYVVDPKEALSLQLRKVLEFMKSAAHRKVNRDMFVVPHSQYDLHSGDTLVELITVVNDALGVFVKQLQAESLWKNTVIVMGSDFGRTLNANANGGTDHAWGGNYFMLGGDVKGGQLLGKYPRPLDATNEFFIPRGRLIPSTPWDAVWNGVANWLGLYEDEELDFTLPNRKRFDKCNDLFFDKDLFKVGACDCNGCSNVNPPPSTSNTLRPTSLPTPLPVTPEPTTPKPTSSPTPAPIPGVPSTMTPTTPQPSKPPTASPTTAEPTTHAPTLPLPEGAAHVNSIFETDSNVLAFGCGSVSDVVEGRAIDGTTEKFVCLKSGTESPGIIVKPSRLSVAKGLRIYSHNNCPNCDAVSYIVEGRFNGDWTPISGGELPWKSANPLPNRNARGSTIESSVSGGDASKVYTEVSFDNDALFKDYRLTFPETRDPSSAYLQFSEVEVTGYVIEEYVTSAPVTAEPTNGLTMSPTPEPSTMMPTSFEPTIASSSLSSTSSLCEGNLLLNSNFEDSLTDWRSWGGASIDLDTGVTGNAVKAYGRTAWRSGPRQDLWQDVLACLTPGTFVHFEFKVRLVDDVTGEGVACDPSSSTDCPMVTVRHATWDYVYDRSIGWDPNNWNSFHGVYQVPAGAWATSVYVMICGGQPGTSLIVDDVSVVIGDPPAPTPSPSGHPITTSSPTIRPVIAAPVCDGNLLSNGNFEEPDMADWRGWAGASVELTAGVTGNAVKAFARTSWRSGPRQDLVGDELTCLVPGTFAHIEFKARLVDDVTGEGVACDPSSSTDCPMVVIRHATWDYVYDRHNNAVWDPENWNSFHGVYQVPSNAWSTSVYLMVCGGQPGTTLIVDDISMVIGDSLAPTPSPSSFVPPTRSPTTSSPVAAGTPTNNIFDAASTVVTTGCTSDKDSTKTKAIDGTTSKFMCFKEAGATEYGIVVSPGHGSLSLAQSLRIYTHNNCPNCDGVSYKLQGRVDSSSAWVDIGSGNLPWFDTWLGRNAQYIAVNSSYENGDSALQYTEVSFPNNSQHFLEYRLVFTATRHPNYYLQLGEVELVGVLFDQQSSYRQ